MGVRSLRDILFRSVALMVTYYGVAASALALTQGTNGIATVWPASGVLLTALLISRPSSWIALLTAAAMASLAANIHAGNPALVSLGFTIANVGEAWLAGSVLIRWCGATPSFLKPSEVARFAAVTGVSASLSAAIAWVSSGAGDAALFWSWLTTDSAGILVVTPVALTICQTTRAERTVIAMRRLAIDLVALGVLSFLALYQSRYPALFLPLGALLVVAYRRGTLGAAAGVLCITFIGSIATALGLGPLSLMRHGAEEQALFFQFYLLVLFALALPAAALFGSRRKLLGEVRKRERLYRLLADNSNDMISLIGIDGIRQYVSPASQAILGYDPEELIGGAPTNDIHPEDRQKAAETCRLLLKGVESPSCTYRQRRRDGDYVWLEATYRLAPDSDAGEPQHFVASTRDVTRRVEDQLALTAAVNAAGEANRLLSMAERIAHVGHWRLDLRANQIFWSSEVFRIHGVGGPDAPALEDAIGFYHEDDRSRVQALIAAALEGKTGFEFEARLVRPDGEVRHVFSKGEPEFADDGELSALFGMVQDVSRRAQAELALAEALEQAQATAREALSLVEVDQLTGTASRRHTLAFLEEQIRKAAGNGSPLAVAMFDIDHFKAVNDRFGHDMGDQVLVRVAAQALGVIRGSDLVGRLGGEEFVVVLPATDALLAMMVGERLRRAVEKSDSGSVPVTISIGVAELQPESDARSLLRDADQALYAAKAAGRNAMRLAA